MTELTPKLSYVSTQKRVKVELTKAMCMESVEPPEDLVQRAKAKLESVKEKSEIDFFYIYGLKLKQIWKQLREGDYAPEEDIVFSLGRGAPILKGLTLEKSSEKGGFVELTIDASWEEVAAWRFGWIKLNIFHQLRKIGVKQEVNPAQIRGAILRRFAGEKVEKIQILPKAKDPTPEEKREKPFSIVASKSRKEISVIIRDASVVETKEKRKDILMSTLQAVKKITQQTGVHYTFLRREIPLRLEGVINGPEKLGLELPAYILAGMASWQETKKVVDTNYKGAGLLSVNISADGLHATIAKFNKKNYESDLIQFDKVWLEKECKRLFLAKSAYEKCLSPVLTVIHSKGDLAGLVIAEGIAATPGAGPFLQYVGAKGKNIENEEEKIIDIRDSGTNSVEIGECIAEVAYETPEVDGVDVYGNTIKAPPPEETFEVEMGDGVEKRPDGKFFSTIVGVPEIKEKMIRVNPIYVHEGDVNLRTGNIYFDGTIEVRGNVESGSVVTAEGDLMVTGSIQGGSVRAKGSIRVKGGIITGEEGHVSSESNIFCDFAENSNIVCAGSLCVNSALLNSNVMVGGDINLLAKRDSHLAGGEIACRGNIKVYNIGFPQGAKTHIRVGLNWKVEQLIHNYKKRQARVQAARDKDKHELRDLVSKKKSQMTDKLQKRKENYQRRLGVARRIMDQLEIRIGELQKKRSYDKFSKIYVLDQLRKNVSLEIGGNVVGVPNDYCGVVVAGRKVSGSHFLAVEDFEDDLQQKAS